MFQRKQQLIGVAAPFTPNGLETQTQLVNHPDLYELASQFMRFYEACPVLSAPGEIRVSRLLLCQRVAETLKNGLGLLGIETVERM